MLNENDKKMTIKFESTNEKDQKIQNAFFNAVSHANANNESLNEFYNSLSNANFQNHIFGRGGSHIWVARKIDGKRVVLISE